MPDNFPWAHYLITLAILIAFVEGVVYLHKKGNP